MHQQAWISVQPDRTGKVTFYRRLAENPVPNESQPTMTLEGSQGRLEAGEGSDIKTLVEKLEMHRSSTKKWQNMYQH